MDLLTSAHKDAPLKECIPIIDLAHVRNGRRAACRARALAELRNAAEIWGCFIVINHGVCKHLMRRLEEEAVRAFSLPRDRKMQLNVLQSGPNHKRLGYIEFYPNSQEYKDVLFKQSLAGLRRTGANVSEFDINLWPLWASSLRNVILEHDNATRKLGLEVLELLTESLGLERDTFSQHFRSQATHTGSWRLHYLEAHPAPRSVTRTKAHSDPSVLTILKESIHGLEIKTPNKEEWLQVQSPPEAYIIFAGDILEAWSNGRFPSADHRVILDEMTGRFSSVNFIEASPSLLIEAPSHLVDEAHPALYAPFPAKIFREHFHQARLAGEYTRGKALKFALRNSDVGVEASKAT